MSGTLLDTLGAKIHPALDVRDGGVIVGRVTEDGYDLVTSERRIYAADDVKDRLCFVPRPYADLAGRWPDEDLAGFLRGEDPPTFSEVLALSISALDDAMEFPRPEHRALIAVWSLGTHFHQLFLTFPRLNFAGEMESGKSKAMAFLRAIAWNALYLLDPTPAVLFRLIDEFRATMLLDEMETLSKEHSREIFAVINSGYKAGGSVPRCEGEKQKRVGYFMCTRRWRSPRFARRIRLRRIAPSRSCSSAAWIVKS